METHIHWALPAAGLAPDQLAGLARPLADDERPLTVIPTPEAA